MRCETEIYLDLLILRLLIFSLSPTGNVVEIFRLCSVHISMRQHDSELKYKAIIAVLAKWFLSDFYIATLPPHIPTMGLHGTTTLQPIVIFYYSITKFMFKLRN